MSAKTATRTASSRRTASPTRAAQKNAAKGRASTPVAARPKPKTKAQPATTKTATSRQPAAPKPTPRRKATASRKPATTRKPAAARKPVSSSNGTRPEATKSSFSTAPGSPVIVGFDFGTNTSCVYAGVPGRKNPTTSQRIPTVVGYADEGIVGGILPDDSHILFGDEALKHRLHLRIVSPLIDGVVGEDDASADFCQHIRETVDPKREYEVRAVIGLPANAHQKAREELREAVTGAFDRVLLIPEPFLAALGFRDETRLGGAGYIDPVSNSIFVDIGAGTTDLCLVQGYYPTARDQISLPFAGDRVDQILFQSILDTYPDTGISLHKVREIKEKHSHVGQPQTGHEVKLIVGGKPRKLEMGPLVAGAANQLAETIFESITELISRAEPDGIEETLRNIILTGGGSRIGHLSDWLENRLEEEGYENPQVQTVGDRYKEYVALGAFKAAQSAREDQWQHLVR